MEATEFTSEALKEILVRPVEPSEEARYQEQMARHHYLGALAKIGETAWYVATWREQWVAQLNLSAAALQCGVRDRWIGWDFRSQYGRLNLIATNRRFLILPVWNQPSIGSRVLSLTSQIRTGFGPEDITRPGRFVVGILKSLQKPAQSIAERMRKLTFRTRLVFDYLRMTKNSIPRAFAR